MNNTGRGLQAIPYKATAIDGIRRMLVNGETFNLVYLDADHEAKAVITQASLVWPMLRKGGILVFDDYGWQAPQGKQGPAVGVNAFLTMFAGDYNLLHTGWQVIIRKSV
jgi:predicted O-methyltransferase YrrM